MRIGAVIMASGFSARMGQNKLLMEYRGKSLAEHMMDMVNDCGFVKTVVVTCYEAVAEMAEEKRMTVVINEHPELGQSQSVILGTRALIDRNIIIENDYLADCGKACGDCTHIIGDSARITGDSTHVTGDTIHIDTAHVTGDTIHIDTAHLTGDSDSKIDGLIYFTADMPFLKNTAVDTLITAFEGCPHSIIRPRFGGKPGNPVIFPADLAGELCHVQGDRGGREVIARHAEQVVFVDISDEKQGVDIDDPQDAGHWLLENGRGAYE